MESDDLNDGRNLERGSKLPCSTMLATCRGSHSIKKQATAAKSCSSSPAVRIIHVFAPEIIKTDPSNFRELVQKLTGKSISRSRCTRHRTTICKRQNRPALPESSSSAAAAAATSRTISSAAPDVKEEEVASSRKSTANLTSFFSGLPHLGSILVGVSQTSSSDHTSQSSPVLPLHNHHVF